jgi:WD40 repeat protein
VVRMWEVGSGREVRRMEHGAWVSGVSFSPDGRFLASGGEDGVVRMWEVGSGREVRRMEHGDLVYEREFQSGWTVFGVGG